MAATRKPKPAPESTPAPADDFDALLSAQPEKSTAERDVAPPSNDDPTTGIDDLLAEHAAPRAEEIPSLTPAQARLAQLRAEAAEIARQEAESAAAAPDPYEGLTAEEINELEELAAQSAARLANKVAATMAADMAPRPVDNSQRGGTGEKIIFHVVHDGFTAFGEVWFRGQEFEIEVGTEAHKRTFDINGNTWLDLIDDANAQIRRWRRHYIAPGEFVPYPGEKFDDELARSDKRRKRQVPVVTSFA